jgi:CBS domain-containing protein
MKQQGIGTILVLTDGTLTGLVTDRDITVRVLAENRDPRTTPIGDICSSHLVVLGPDDDLALASRLVRDHAVRRIPVLQDGTPVGVVAVGDLALGSGTMSDLSGMSSAPPND